VALVSGGLFAHCRLAIVALARGSGGLEGRLAEIGHSPEILIDRARMRARDLPTMLIRLRRVIAKTRPHIVIASLPQANLLARIGVLFDQSVTLVSFEHNSHLAKRVYEIGYRLTSWRVNWSFADTESTMRTASARLYLRKPAKQTVVPLVSFDTPANRSYVPPSDGVFRVVNAGRLTSVKNQAALIEAIAVLERSNRRVSLTLFGEGPEREAYESLARQLGVAASVRFAGFDSDWSRGAADLFVLASKHEGLCMVVLEAMHAGIPVAAPLIGGLRDYAAPGLVRELSAVDANTIAEAIGHAMADAPASQATARKAAEMIDKRFGVERVRETYRAVNEALIKQALEGSDSDHGRLIRADQLPACRSSAEGEL
jgi:glycosyltransferase involved in cell wall biosynthesis